MDLLTAYECARACQLAYQTPDQNDIRRAGLECTEIECWDEDCCQGFVLEQQERFLVVYRGTTYEDVMTNLQTRRTLLTCGGVHSGFLAYARKAFPALKAILSRCPGKPVVFTGHSLGGAAAVIAATVLHAEIRNQILTVVTFGAPRVGDSDFAAISQFLVPHERWVKANDGVTKVPLLLRGYRHSGNANYISSRGVIWLKANPLVMFFDRWFCFRTAPWRWACDKVRDHRMAGYVEAIGFRR